MDKEEIKLDDWNRILFGEASPAYLLEVVVRVAFVYLLILIAMRFMGKRMIGELGRADLVARVSLAAAVGLPVQRPGRGLLVAAVIVFVIVWVGRGLARLAFRNHSFEKKFQGVHATLIKDGIIDRQRLSKVRITREQLFAALRGREIRHLGQVKRLYMEANGEFSLVLNKEVTLGLSIIPEWDTELRRRQQKTDVQLCKECGATREQLGKKCSACGGKELETAIVLQDL